MRCSRTGWPGQRPAITCRAGGGAVRSRGVLSLAAPAPQAETTRASVADAARRMALASGGQKHHRARDRTKPAALPHVAQTGGREDLGELPVHVVARRLEAVEQL